MKANPFFELYVGDRISSSEFVTIFSPLLVPHTEPLFLPGNIVVTGIQGCGKSMLLKLLKPQTRIEYEKAREPFPVPSTLRKFVCGSVNLAHSSVIDFGYRDSIDEDVQKTEIMFADFLNYLVCDSLLEALSIYGNASQDIRDEVGLRFSLEQMNALAREVSNLEVWEGWVGECNSISELRARLQRRTKLYRRYVHGKDSELSPDVFDTATPVGAPQAAIAELLHTSGAIDSDTHVFVDIDQYEELGNISSRDTPGQSVDYRSVINKALASRNPEISYRIGTRGYSWRSHGRIHGTNGNLEFMRDYKYIELDQILKKDESDSARADNVFDSFARDVFERRLRYAQFAVSPDEGGDLLERVYGTHLTPQKKINLMSLRDPEKYIVVDQAWSESTKVALKSLAKRDLFSAKLGEFYTRQKGDRESLEVKDDQLPWMRNSNRWWRKERSNVLSIILASQSRQKSIWGGADEVLELSGGSILVFLGLNQFIWSTWLQKSGTEHSRTAIPEISVTVQSTAIMRTSHAWFDMIYQQSGRSAERARFVKQAATDLRQKLLKDDKLSYPGANGFSLTIEDLDNFPSIRGFLEQLADYGNMLMLDHTTKNVGGGQRKKFYFHPILCPSLGLPYVRTKEPHYSKVKEVADWIQKSGFEVSLAHDGGPQQEELF
ncbi:hypothetical protein SAMN05421666_1142 [Roseovarius nanhaiticus]|uniref:Uncharacterized protein n=1 Tax=Roseovarius nanhaiticus TaxID=573024 RepID=A0A1N7FKZ1_9RHOB|nr:hypothetical protein [Roseovarius nanhaiticus]SEK51915.1 hypothetical protein SAMN05216208_0994 [Roseovarius nanhaiticus]SIS01042.1 hypothetical protein SAMN05421666_1142 [Roseovarius nanhaiticus]